MRHIYIYNTTQQFTSGFACSGKGNIVRGKRILDGQYLFESIGPLLGTSPFPPEIYQSAGIRGLSHQGFRFF